MSQSFCLSTYLALYIVRSASCWVGLSKSSEPSKKQKNKRKTTEKPNKTKEAIEN